MKLRNPVLPNAVTNCSGTVGPAKSEQPKSEQEKRDQWMTRFSRAVGKDLGPFFERWGVPVSAEARATLSDLPKWVGAAK